ncbi:MAG: hypothetical protein Q9213_001010 [Squamulea squamosa]
MSQRPPLAIVGYAYRAPGVGRKGLWEFLEEGKSAWSAVPPDRFNHDAFYHPNAEKPGFISSKGACFLPDDLYAFDPSFFKISAEEARTMDPQHRILLECAFEAAENAGVTLPNLLGSNTGVYAAGVDSDYNLSMAKDLPTSSKYVAVGGAQTMFANRLSYFFGLTGPSVTIDTACASSAYALHLACQGVLAGECSTAFVGGSKLILGPFQWMGLDMMGTLSPEGRCFSFDSRASGFGKGEGAACMIIKRLSDALACGDEIRAIIRNSVCNHSGRTQGISMPSQALQKELLLRVHRDIGVDPNETSFVEQAEHHIRAMVQEHPLGIQLKPAPSRRHLEGASGLISIIKCIMMLERGVMLPNADFTEMNPEIGGHDRLKRDHNMTNGNAIHHDIDSIHLKKTIRNHATVDGGVDKNDMAIPDPTDVGLEEHLFVFSAQSSNSLGAYLSTFVEYLEEEPKSIESAKGLAFTLGQRRTHFAHRVAVAAISTSSLKDQLQSIPKIAKSGKTKDPVIAFTFTGQGAQYFQMSAGLRKYKEFAETILAVEQILRDLGARWSLTEELDKPEHESRVDDAEISQPACTAIQLALVAVLQSWGISPTVVLGHSSGEIAAAYTAGLVSFRAAVAIAYFRGIAARQLLTDPRIQGAMLAIGASAEEAQKLLDAAKGCAVVAAVNSPHSVTVSGDVAAIEDVHDQAEKQGLFVRRLKVGVAYHSRQMERVADSYLASIESFCSADLVSSDRQSTRPLFISTVTGQKESAEPAHASYWVWNLLRPVQYLKAMEALSSQMEGKDRMPNVMIEIGPHSALQSATKQILNRISQPEHVTYLPSLVRGKNATSSLLNLAGDLFAFGADVDLAAINQTKSSPVKTVNNLPPYEWNKTATYIHQSRLAANWLHGGAPYNRLLGWKSPYSEGNEHAFRNVFTLDDLPWIRDHVVSGDVLFPFTGFLSLAIEGFRSLNSKVAPAVLIREFHVTASLKIEEDQQIDLTTKLRPAATGTETVSATAWTFEILTWSDSHQWTRHSYGLIEADQNPESLSKGPHVQSALKTLNGKTLQQHDGQDEYALLKSKYGLAYGPNFRNMAHLRQEPGATVSTIVLRHLDSDAHALGKASPVTVDPPTLDSIFHCLGALLGRSGPRPTMVPSFCLRWRISNHIDADPGRQFSVVCKLLDSDEKSGTTHIQFVIFDVSTTSSPPKPVAEIGPVKLQCIDRPDARDLGIPDSYVVKHVPYVDLVDPQVLSKMVQGSPASIAQLRQRHDLDCAAIYFLSRMLKEVANDDMSGLPTHHIRFLDWAKRAIMAPQSPVVDSAGLVDKVSSSNDTGKMICAVGAQLPQIIRGEQQPLDIMLEDGLLQRLYEQHESTNRVNQVAARYIAHLAGCNPDLNILEIGGGTASATLPILESIQSATEGLAPYFHYTFTDISASFFDNARVKLSPWKGQLTYSKMDISQDPLQQGFAAESYDVVLASNVLHATPNIVTTLNNARALLKPNGKLVLMEAVVEAAPHFMPFVLLDGWWLSKDSYRSPSDGPLLTKGLWSDVLEANGFSGVEGFVDDHPGQPEHLFSAMWSTKRNMQGTTQEEKADSSVTVYHCFHGQESLEFPKAVSDNLAHQLGGTPTVKHLLQNGNDEKNLMCVVLDSQQRSIFSDLSSEMFYKVKSLLLQAPSLLWVLPTASHPDASIIKGLLRALRLEASSSRFILLEAPFNAHGAGAIGRVAQYMAWDPSSAINDEQEYALIDNILHVPRLQLVEAPKETFIMEAGGSVKGEQNVWHGDAAIEMTVDAVGSPDSVHFRHSDILNTELGDEEIIVRVAAVGMNFRDLLLVIGSLSWHAPGLEGAGVVARVGSRVNDMQVGDRVFYIVHEAGMANLVRMPSLRAYRIPENLNMIDAASMPVAYSTAIMSMIEIGCLRKGETVLIHSASGAVGQACAMIAQQIGAQIFATAGSAAKREFVARNLGIPTSQVFSSRSSEFKDGILQATENRGVDVIVNSLSGHLLQQTWDLIAENGRFIEIGKKDLLENNYLPMRHFDKNVTFSAIDLRKVAAARPEAVREWLSNIVRMVEGQKIMLIHPVTRVPISQVQTGLRKLQSGQNIGKIVLTVGADETVTVKRLSPLRAGSGNLLRSDATYLISGGTGGLGRALASWMIKKGARNLVLLGRSSTPSAKVIELLRRYEGTDVRIRAIACDVGSWTALNRTAEELKCLPKVCGIIHGALFLRVSQRGLDRRLVLTLHEDAIFSNATFEDWEQVMGPKVRGAWHLHKLFPKLDFFVSLSSTTGIVGRTGTSLYTGTSTFLDAFSEYRVKLGLPAVSVDLPIVESVGLAVERGTIGQLRASLGVTITEDQFYTLIEGAIIGPSSGLNAYGRSLSWTLATKADIDSLVWEHFNPLSVMRRLRAYSGGVSLSSNESKKLQELLKDGSPELLMDALSDKVSTITMIDRDEITPDRSLLDYGLDSLFSLELRNWVRRSLKIDMVLKDITSARDLRALVDRILPLMKGTVSTTPSQGKIITTPATEGDLEPGSSNLLTNGMGSEALPISPLLGVQVDERESIQKHLQSIGIDISNVELVLPCAPVQEGILFAQLKNQQRQYFECPTLRITTEGATGYVDIDKITAAWKALCMAQPMLRTVFTSSPSSVGAFQQVILKRTDPPVSYATVDLQAGLDRILKTMEEPQFAAAQPPHHMHLTRASSSVVYASFYMNHALFDNRSFRLIGQQLCQAYVDLASISKGLDMSRYISWVLNHPVPAKDYWRAHLSDTQPCFVSILSSYESSLLDKTSPPYIDLSINQPHVLHPFCRRYGLTVANVVQVAWAIVLYQCTGSQSVTFGCGQSQMGAVDGDEKMLGPLLTNMICRFNVCPRTTLLELLKGARNDSLQALELPSYSMAELHEAIGLGRSSLFDTAMTIVRYPSESPTTAGGIQAEFIRPTENSTEYAILIGMGYDNDKIISRLFYDATRVSRSLVEKIGDLFEAVVMKIVRDSNQSVATLELSINKPSAAYTAQDVARSVYREAASQCELATSSLEDLCPCSAYQQQQVQTSFQRESGGCMDQYVFEVPKHVSMTRLCDALVTVAAASPVLRTRFVSLRQGGLCQVTVKATPGWNEEASLVDYLQWDRGFQIRYGGPLCRYGEVDQPDGRRYFVLSLHPATYDPWTLSLILNAVNKVYENQGEPPTSFPSFSDYIRRLPGSNDAQGAQDFWRARPQWSHEASLQFPRVPHDAPGADLSTSSSLAVQLPFKDIGDDNVPTILAVLPAAWALCLSRLNGDRKACFGIHVDGRSVPIEGILHMTGPIAAVIPCAIDLATLSTGDSLSGVIKEYTKAATPYLQLPSSQTATSQGIGATSQTFSNVLIVYDDSASVRQKGLPEILRPVQTRLSASSFHGARLVVRCNVKSNEQLNIEFQYDKQILSPEDIEILLQQYRHAIIQLLLKASTPLADLEPLSSHDKSLLSEWNMNSPNRVDACIQDQIRDVAKGKPVAPAICSWDSDLDYGQLDDLSDRVAALLQKNGLRVGTIVPYFCEKSAAAVVIMLGIIKAGGALVGMDKNHPKQRLSTILSEVGASTIIVSSSLVDQVNAKVAIEHTVVVDMEVIRSLPRGRSEKVAIQPLDTCVVLYTSGSTGTPKGIVISHCNFATSVHHNRGSFGMSAETRTLQFSNFIFDAVMYEVFMTLVSGGCVCIPEEAERLDNLPGAIQRTGANYALLSPSTATLLSPPEVPTLRTLCLIGEQFPRHMIEKWKNVRLINGYGPSETTICTSLHVVSPTTGKHHLNVGRPSACRYWVVDPDNHHRLVPIGCLGELLVQGPVVAQGYLGDEAKTKEAFIEPPNWTSDFTAIDMTPRWYKTGDLVMQTADGSVTIHGRKGTQIKLAGQRVELGEIEHHLRQLSDPSWKLAVELIRPDHHGQNSSLAMFFVVPSTDDKRTNSETPCQILPPLPQEALLLKKALESRLPAYMVPQYFIRLDRMPLTGSNKLARQSLRKLGANLSPEQLSAYAGLVGLARQEKAPGDVINVEMRVDRVKHAKAELRKLWARSLALPLDRIKTTDNYFDLGGSSLRATHLVNAARRAGFTLSVTDVFATPVLSDLAAIMRPVTSGTTSTLSRKTKLKPRTPLTSSSTVIGSSLRTCLMEHGFMTDNIDNVTRATDTQADMVAVSELDGKAFKGTFFLDYAAPGVEVTKIARACEKVIRDHSILRTVFVQHGPTLLQVVLKAPPKGIVQVTTNQKEEEEDEKEEGIHVGNNTVLGHRLPCFRLQAKGTKCHKLRLKIHHALYDAISLPLVLQDLRSTYAQQSIPTRPSFQAWISHLESLDKVASKKFWTQTLHGSSMTYLVQPPTELQPTSGNICSEEILIRVPMIKTSHGTCASVVQAAWALVLSRITGEQDIVFGAPNANRDPASFPDVDRFAGPCTEYLPIRAQLEGVSKLGSLVEQLQAQGVAAIPHRHVGFRDIIRTCTDWPVWTRFSNIVVYQTDEGMAEVGPSVKYGDVSCAVTTTCEVGSSADMWLVAKPTASMEELTIRMGYSRRTIPEEKTQQIARLFRTVLEAMPEVLEKPIEQVAVVDEQFRLSTSDAVAMVQPRRGQGAGGVEERGLATSVHLRTVVSQAWEEVGLVLTSNKGDGEKQREGDASMFSCGADLVTTMLLSRCYQRRGYDLSMQDLLDLPTKEGQAALLETKKKGDVNEKVGGEVDGKVDGEVNGMVDGEK